MSPQGSEQTNLGNPGRGRSVYLLGLLLLLFVAVPVLDGLRGDGASQWMRNDPDQPLRGHALEILVNMVLVVAAVTVAQTRKPWVVVLLLVGPPLSVRILERVGVVSGEGVQAAIEVYVGLALLYVVGRGLQRFFHRGRVTVDTIATSICAYILMGLAWTYLYAAAETVAPDAFGRASQETADLFYFSFVTLTTLGYGDLTPKIPTVRSLAIVQAIVGQMYVAVVLARLVSMYIAPDQQRNEGDE